MLELKKQIRNLNYIPNVKEEGEFLKPMPSPPSSMINETKLWYAKLKPSDRMFYHQTLSSTRRFTKFVPFPCIAKDSLDFSLTSEYDQQLDLFANKQDIYLQPITFNDTGIRIRNTIDVLPEIVIPLGHPLCIGGIQERISPHSVKLMNTGHHTPQTNPGYSRQTSDGNYFNY